MDTKHARHPEDAEVREAAAAGVLLGAVALLRGWQFFRRWRDTRRARRQPAPGGAGRAASAGGGSAAHPPTPQNAGRPEDDPAARASLPAGHETTDVNVRGLFLFGGALLAAVAGILVGLALLFRGFEAVNTRLDGRIARREPAASSRVRLAPDYQGPLLQVKPEEDLRWMRDRNAVDLNSYGWVDRRAGVVRLPIDRAMDLLAERGLPPVSPGKTLEALQRERAQPQVFGQSLRP